MATRIDPSDPVAWTLKALVAYAAGDLPAAGSALARSVGLNPGEDPGEGFEALFRPYLAYRLSAAIGSDRPGESPERASFVRNLRK